MSLRQFPLSSKLSILALSAVAIPLCLAACTGAGKKPDRQTGEMMRPKSPPIAAKKPKAVTLHGDERVDDYHWLREKDSPEVVAHLKAETAWAEAVLEPTAELQEELFAEIKARIKQTDLGVPVREGGYWYYERTEEGKQYETICRKKGTLEAEEQIILDLNKMAEGHKFMALGGMEVTTDGRLLAYSTDTTGFRDYTLHVKDLDTGELLDDTIPKVKSFAWAADQKTIFYALDDHAKRAYRLYRHVLGEKQDELLYEEKDERFLLHVVSSRDDAYIILGSHSHTTTEMRILPASDPTGTWKVVAPRVPEQEYFVESHGDTFFILTNDKGRNFRVVTAPVASPGRDNWEELIPHDPDVMRTELDVFADHYVLSEREAGLPQLRVGTIKTGETHRIPMPEAAYAIFEEENPEFGVKSYRFSYQSMTTPKTVYEYDLETRQKKVLKETEVLGGYDRGQYETQRLQATAPDGTEIPISLVSRKGTPQNGSAPMLLVGYGSYGFSYPVHFSHARISLLDRGVVYAIAHIRGGGEMGKRWHDQGRMKNKSNTFTDFVAVAEHLIAQKYTSREKLAIAGGSAGGLLMGAVANSRPDLFKAVLLDVPFVDVLNTMLDDDLPLTVGEYEEWGNPKLADQYQIMKAYCPYTNIEAKTYPAILVLTSFDDSQVMYWEPAKYVAKMRALKKDDNPLLFRVNMGGGHGGSSGRYDQYREVAFEYAFLLWQFGLID